MPGNKNQTEAVLDQFNKNFQKSRQEMIDRFLKDQDQLNKRFKEYSLDSDNENNVSKKKASNPEVGITYDYLDRTYGGGNQHNDETESVTSLMTQCSFSDCDDPSKTRVTKKPTSSSAARRKDRAKDMGARHNSSHDPEHIGTRQKLNHDTPHTGTRQKLNHDKQPPTATADCLSPDQRPSSAAKSKEEVCQRLSLSTPRFGVPERKDLPFSRSKSLRAPSKTPVSTVLSPHSVLSSHPEQPPNSPEEVRKNASRNLNNKPGIDGIRTGRKSLDRQERPKKLLTKRSVRPKTAMGIQSNEISPLLPDTEPNNQERIQCQPNPSWDSEMVRAGLVRSAPLKNRNRMVSWDLEETGAEEPNLLINRKNSLVKSKVPPLPLSVAPNNDANNNPSYASTYDGAEQKTGKASRSKTITNNSKPFVKSSSDYFPMSQKDIGCGTSGKVAEYSKIKKVEKTSSMSNSGPSSKAMGSLRRYKGHSNLTGESPSKSTRGHQLAVLKLPPVSKKKHPSDGPSRSSTSMGYFRNEAQMIKMMPVHIGEEF